MPLRILKRSVLVLAFAAFLILIVSRVLFVFADAAVVNADKREFLAPEAAVVRESFVDPFADVKGGAPIVRIETLVQDASPLVAADQAVSAARDAVDARREQTAALLAERARLEGRLVALLEAARASVAERIAAREAELVGLAEERERRGRDLDRTQDLAGRRVVSEAALDQTAVASRKSRLDHEAAANRLTALRIQQRLIAAGLMVEEGTGDVAYTAQRLDEVALKLIDAEREARQAELALAGALTRREAERASFERRHAITFLADRDARILPPVAPVGRTIPAGGTVAVAADCAGLFMDVVVAEEDGARFALGQAVRFRLVGSEKEWTGTVAELSANGGSAALRPTFVAPRTSRRTWLLARIAPEAAFMREAALERDCAIGRTAVLKTRSSGLLAPFRAAFRDVF